MPRSVRIALACSIAVGLLGLVGSALLVADLVASLYLGRAPLRATWAFSPQLVVALAFPPILRRRDTRNRELSFQVGLLAAMGLGFLELFLLVTAVLRGFDARTVVMSLTFGLVVAFAWSLSRPSAKAWFAVKPVARQAGAEERPQ
jgi:hypothetical protein